MYFLGIDHSLNKTAIVCIDKNGKYVGKIVYKNKKHKGMQRLLMLLKFFIALREKYRNEISYIGMENYSFGSRGRAIFNIGEAGGLVRLVLNGWVKKKYFLFAPKSVKKFASGSGNANKKAMIKAVKKKWKFNAKKDHDVADAFAVAQLTRCYVDFHKGKFFKKEDKELLKKIKGNING